MNKTQTADLKALSDSMTAELSFYSSSVYVVEVVANGVYFRITEKLTNRITSSAISYIEKHFNAECTTIDTINGKTTAHFRFKGDSE